MRAASVQTRAPSAWASAAITSGAAAARLPIAASRRDCASESCAVLGSASAQATSRERSVLALRAFHSAGFLRCALERAVGFHQRFVEFERGCFRASDIGFRSAGGTLEHARFIIEFRERGFRVGVERLLALFVLLGLRDALAQALGGLARALLFGFEGFAFDNEAMKCCGACCLGGSRNGGSSAMRLAWMVPALRLRVRCMLRRRNSSPTVLPVQQQVSVRPLSSADSARALRPCGYGRRDCGSATPAAPASSGSAAGLRLRGSRRPGARGWLPLRAGEAAASWRR